MLSAINVQLCQLPSTRTPIQLVVRSLGRLASVLPDLESHVQPGLAALAPAVEEQRLRRFLEHLSLQRQLMGRSGWQAFCQCARKLVRIVRRTGAWSRVRNRRRLDPCRPRPVDASAGNWISVELMAIDGPAVAGTSANSSETLPTSPEAQLLRLAQQLSGGTGARIGTILLQFSAADANSSGGADYHCCHCVTVNGGGGAGGGVRQTVAAAAFVTHEVRTVGSAAEAEATIRETARRFRDIEGGGGVGGAGLEFDPQSPELAAKLGQAGHALHEQERLLETQAGVEIRLVQHRQPRRKSLHRQLLQHDLEDPPQPMRDQTHQTSERPAMCLPSAQNEQLPLTSKPPHEQLSTQAQIGKGKESEVVVSEERQSSSSHTKPAQALVHLQERLEPLHEDLQHQQLQHEDLQHQQLQHEDLQHQQLQHEDLQHQQQLQYEDMQHLQFQLIDQQAGPSSLLPFSQSRNEQLLGVFQEDMQHRSKEAFLLSGVSNFHSVPLTTGFSSLSEQNILKDRVNDCEEHTLISRQSDREPVSKIKQKEHEASKDEDLQSHRSREAEPETRSLHTQIQELQVAAKQLPRRTVDSFRASESRIKKRWAIENSTIFRYAERMVTSTLAEHTSEQPERNSNPTLDFESGIENDGKTGGIIVEELNVMQHPVLATVTALQDAQQAPIDQPDLASTRTLSTSYETVGRSTEAIESNDSDDSWRPVTIYRNGCRLKALRIPEEPSNQAQVESKGGKALKIHRREVRQAQSSTKVRRRSVETPRHKRACTDDAPPVTPGNVDARHNPVNAKPFALKASSVTDKDNARKDGVKIKIQRRDIADERQCRERSETLKLMSKKQKPPKDIGSKAGECDAMDSRSKQSGKPKRLLSESGRKPESGEKSKASRKKEKDQPDHAKEKARTSSTTKVRRSVAEAAGGAANDSTDVKQGAHSASNPKERERERRESEIDAADTAATNSSDVNHISRQQTKVSDACLRSKRTKKLEQPEMGEAATVSLIMASNTDAERDRNTVEYSKMGERDDEARSNSKHSARSEKSRSESSLKSETGRKSKSGRSEEKCLSDRVKEKARTSGAAKARRAIAEAAGGAAMEKRREENGQSAHSTSNPAKLERGTSRAIEAADAAATFSSDVSRAGIQQAKLQSACAKTRRTRKLGQPAVEEVATLTLVSASNTDARGTRSQRFMAKLEDSKVKRSGRARQLNSDAATQEPPAWECYSST